MYECELIMSMIIFTLRNIVSLKSSLDSNETSIVE